MMEDVEEVWIKGKWYVVQISGQGTIMKGNRIHDNTFSHFVNSARQIRIEANDIYDNASGLVLDDS